ncbi:hypothetical protein E2986_08541 [Frieseomelitta varia]|uniref:Uncharacterized protein n=1 Tax=Frieseomelitta varia TaxID=561572 RepID=A0A833VY96_9HYME|nr:hypothetical protein E2986_08541 [Frieseomelitta varia]
MRPIGWTLACALLAATFPKRAILPGVQSVGVATSSYQREAGRANVTKSLSIISKDASVDPDIQGLSWFIDDTLVGGWNEVRDKKIVKRDVKYLEKTSRQARTFGHKRIQFMLMPMMYKMGVMMTMLTVLTMISLKGLLIGDIDDPIIDKCLSRPAIETTDSLHTIEKEFFLSRNHLNIEIIDYCSTTHNMLTLLNRSTCTYTIAYQSLTIKRTAAGCRQADQKIWESNTTTTEDEFL